MSSSESEKSGEGSEGDVGAVVGGEARVKVDMMINALLVVVQCLGVSRCGVVCNAGGGTCES